MTRNPLRRFPPGVTEKLDHYVYRYEFPKSIEGGRVFYVGRGENDRVFAHLAEAESPQVRGRKVDAIRRVWEAGLNVNVVIVRYGLTLSEAILAEQILIDAYPFAESDPEATTNKVRGEGAKKANLDVDSVVHELAAKPAKIDFRCFVVFLTKGWALAKPERSIPVCQDILKHWTCGDWGTNLAVGERSSVEFAVAVHGGIIRQVYRIVPGSWKSLAAPGKSAKGRSLPRRYRFDASVAEEMHQLVGCRFPYEKKRGDQREWKWYDPTSSPVPVHPEAVTP